MAWRYGDRMAMAFVGVMPAGWSSAAAAIVFDYELAEDLFLHRSGGGGAAWCCPLRGFAPFYADSEFAALSLLRAPRGRLGVWLWLSSSEQERGACRLQRRRFGAWLFAGVASP